MPLKKQPAPKNSRIWFLFRKALKNDSFHFSSKKESAFIHSWVIHSWVIHSWVIHSRTDKSSKSNFFACDVLMSFLNLQGNGDKKQNGSTKTTFNFGDFLPTTIG